jgi:hypothetical protein
MPPTIAPESLCPTCCFVRLVRGRRGQTYVLCRNEKIEAKYPRQPVLSCPGYEPGGGEAPAEDSSTGPLLTS